jgi:hypothetical protein
MDDQILSPSALAMLRQLINDERDNIRSGNVSYGTAQDSRDALEDLDELDERAAAIAGAKVSA